MGEYSVQILLLFLVVLLVSFTCGIFRGLKKYYKRKAVLHHQHHLNATRNIVVTHIEVPSTVNNVNNELITSGVLPNNGQLNPPPYSVVSDQPPSYEEVVTAYHHDAIREGPPSYKE